MNYIIEEVVSVQIKDFQACVKVRRVDRPDETPQDALISSKSPVSPLTLMLLNYNDSVGHIKELHHNGNIIAATLENLAKEVVLVLELPIERHV